MENKLEQIREQQKDSWNKFSPGWKKWDNLTMDFLKPMGDGIIDYLSPKDDQMILDVASGTGEPGLSLAAGLKSGKVILTDLSEDMLAIAREHAAIRGIRNVETVVCDVSDLPFADNIFDAISCRFGFMFFPDMLLASKELARVLKPGGKIATTVWSKPEKNFWVTAIGETINRNMQLPAPPPGAPGMFRCAQSGLITNLFREAGLKNLKEKEISGSLNCGSPEVYWDMMTEVAAPFVAALGKADELMKEKIRREVFELVKEKYPEGKLRMDASALLITGEK